MTVSPWRDRASGQPPLEADVAVVGAGVTGASIAWWLAGQGRRVAVVDRAAEPAAGASGRNAGFLTCGSVAHFARRAAELSEQTAVALRRMSLRNIEHVRDRLVADGLQCELRMRGTVSVAADDEEMAELDGAAAVLRRHGMSAERVDGAYVERELGMAGFAGGVRCAEDGELHPVRLVEGLLERAAPTLLLGHEARALEERDDRVIVHTDRRRIEAERAVVATNGWAGELHPWLAARIEPARGQALATEPVQPLMGATCYARSVLAYARQTAEGRVVAGGFRELSRAGGAADGRVEPAVDEAIERFVRERFAGLAQARIDYRWAGTLGFSSDGLPLVGRIPGTERTYVCGGYCGHGMGWALEAGRLLAELLRTGSEPALVGTSRLA